MDGLSDITEASDGVVDPVQSPALSEAEYIEFLENLVILLSRIHRNNEGLIRTNRELIFQMLSVPGVSNDLMVSKLAAIAPPTIRITPEHRTELITRLWQRLGVQTRDGVAYVRDTNVTVDQLLYMEKTHGDRWVFEHYPELYREDLDAAHRSQTAEI